MTELFNILNITETNNCYLEKLLKNNLLKQITNELHLKEVPEINYTISGTYIMQAVGCFNKNEDGTIKSTESLYLINVNLKALRNIQDRFFNLTLNESIKLDITEVILRHECRHLWQQQEDAFVGYPTSIYKDKSTDHGLLPQEEDANLWAISTCPKKAENLALRIKHEQDNSKHHNQIGTKYLKEIMEDYPLGGIPYEEYDYEDDVFNVVFK